MADMLEGLDSTPAPTPSSSWRTTLQKRTPAPARSKRLTQSQGSIARQDSIPLLSTSKTSKRKRQAKKDDLYALSDSTEADTVATRSKKRAPRQASILSRVPTIEISSGSEVELQPTRPPPRRTRKQSSNSESVAHKKLVSENQRKYGAEQKAVQPKPSRNPPRKPVTQSAQEAQEPGQVAERSTPAQRPMSRVEGQLRAPRGGHVREQLIEEDVELEGPETLEDLGTNYFNEQLDYRNMLAVTTYPRAASQATTQKELPFDDCSPSPTDMQRSSSVEPFYEQFQIIQPGPSQATTLKDFSDDDASASVSDAPRYASPAPVDGRLLQAVEAHYREIQTSPPGKTSPARMGSAAEIPPKVDKPETTIAPQREPKQLDSTVLSAKMQLNRPFLHPSQFIHKQSPLRRVETHDDHVTQAPTSPGVASTELQTASQINFPEPESRMSVEEETGSGHETWKAATSTDSTLEVLGKVGAVRHLQHLYSTK